MKRAELGKEVTPQQWRTVTSAIKEAFPNNWRGHVSKLRYHYLEGCYSFIFAGMFVGVELDGYIHT